MTRASSFKLNPSRRAQILLAMSESLVFHEILHPQNTAKNSIKMTNQENDFFPPYNVTENLKTSKLLKFTLSYLYIYPAEKT